MKIRAKYQLLASALIVSVVVAIAAMVIRTQGSLLREQAVQRLEALMDGVQRIAKESLDSRDRLMVVSYLLFLQKTYPELAFASVSYGGHDARIGEEADGLLYLQREAELAPQAAGGRPLACLVRLGFAGAAIDAQVKKELAGLIRWTAGIAGLFLLLGLLANAWVTRLLTGPIEDLARGTEALAAGKMDFSVPVRSSDELGTLTASFNSMTKRLKDLLDSREDILHTLTHEINTPLSGLKGYLELWQDQKLAMDPASTGEILNIMTAAVLRMESSLTNALKLFREERVSEGEPEAEVRVEDVFREVVSVYKPLARAGGVTILPLNEIHRGSIVCREELLRRIISNLVSNAMKYTPQGGEVNMGIADKETEIVFYVRNTGRGIPAEDIPHLFTKFFRSEQDRNTGARIPGTGLGLNIVQKAVTALGGRVWVESYIDQFTVFFVMLPKQRGNTQSSAMDKL